MSSDPTSSPSGRPRVGLRVEDEVLRAKISALLADEELDLEFLESDETLGDLIEQSDVDLIVAPRDELSDPHRSLQDSTVNDSEAPGVVLLQEEALPGETARLVAQGASNVLDPTDRAEALAGQIAAYAYAEVEGGLDGPEVGGSEAEPKLADFQSQSPSMRDFVDLVERVADSDASLLIRGETGVGKERLARAVHAESSRSDKPFVIVNCGALPENLLESELFGHCKGAFTGATEDRPGRFEQADGGTLFLDEIGEMPLHLQVKLLTVLQRREIQRLGGTAIEKVDVRILAATNRDLDADVANNLFREDLLFRLRVVELLIPPLRDRAEDLPHLTGAMIRHFRATQAGTVVQGISNAAMRVLMTYAWPGNVRELINVVERGMLLARGKQISLDDLPPEVTLGPLESAGPTSRSSEAALFLEEGLLELPLAESRRRILAHFEERYLRALLRRNQGKVGDTAKDAGINPRTLYDKLKLYGIDKQDFISR